MKRKLQKQIFLSVAISVAILFGFLFVIPNVAQQSPSPSPNSVSSPAKNTSPATKTPTKQANPKSTNTTPANSPSPLPTQPNNSNQQNSPSQNNPNFWQRNEGDLIKWTGTIITALLAGAVSIYGFRYNRKSKLEEIQLQNQLTLKTEEKKADLEKKKAEEKATQAAAAELKTKEERKNIVADFAEQYRQKIVTEICNLSICNLPNAPSSLSLDSVFVELSVSEEELLSYTNLSEIDSLAEGDPNKLLKRSQLYLIEKSIDGMSPVEALVKFPQMTVLGDPGAGKTTMLRFLALKMAQRQENRLPYLPLYVELGKFVQSDTKNLLKFIAKEFDLRYGFPEAIDYLTEQLNKGKVALLCDGLDEVLGGESEEKAQAAYNLAVDEINRFRTRFSQAPIVVTCRKAGWRRGLTGFETLEVLDFSWEQIQDFIHNWFKSNPDKENGLKQALAENIRMQTLAANPLIVSLITIVYQQDLELPERRAELYKRCLAVLLREWDSSRQIKRYSNCNTDHKLNLLKEIAWHFHVQGKRYFTKEQLLKIIAIFLNTHDINPKKNNVFLKEIADHYGLLKEQAISYYGFLHLTFQEYLTALATSDDIENRLPTIISLHRDPWYTEVILLLSQMMEDATPLVLGILGHSINTQSLPKGKLAIKDDLFHGDLFLAARCLVGKPIISLQGLREKIIAEVKDLLLNSPYVLDWENAANVLMEIGGQKLENNLFEILENSEQNQWRRKVIAIALGKYGSHETAQVLVEFVKKEAKKVKANEIVIEGVIDSLIKLKAKFTSSQILAILEEQRCFSTNKTLFIKSNLAKALGELGEQTMVSPLMDILQKEEKEIALIKIGIGSRLAIIESIVRLSNREQTSDLLSMLPKEHSDELTKLAIAIAMKFSKHISELADSIIGYLKNESIEWQTRFVLAESLENLSSEQLKSLLPILDNLDIDFRVRAGIAATFGVRKIENATPFLQQVLEEMNKCTFYLINKKLDQIILPDLRVSNFTYRGYIWQRISLSFKNLNNNSIVSTFIGSFKNDISALENNPDVFVPDVLGNVEGVIHAASIFKPEEISQQLMQLLSQPELINYHSDITKLITWLVTKPFIPQLLDLLTERYEYKVNQEVWGRIVTQVASY
ncbi:MAG: NACHT domain-containing protein [Xenococcus sp. MO_188.B8]|nr:NACHT domain-containing protein [Xenococcus sp. MO_188.B8]